jgi:hypothetical protein
MVWGLLLVFIASVFLWILFDRFILVFGDQFARWCRLHSGFRAPAYRGEEE